MPLHYLVVFWTWLQDLKVGRGTPRSFVHDYHAPISNARPFLNPLGPVLATLREQGPPATPDLQIDLESKPLDRLPFWRYFFSARSVKMHVYVALVSLTRHINISAKKSSRSDWGSNPRPIRQHRLALNTNAHFRLKPRYFSAK
jgi:hypothetical protein